MGALINLSLSVPVVAGWGVWLAAGLIMLVWARHAREANLRADVVRSVARPVAARSVAARPPKPAPAPVDAFGELQALLEPQADLTPRDDRSAS